MVQGTGFNWDKPDHFRVVFLPNLIDLEDAMDRLDRFLPISVRSLARNRVGYLQNKGRLLSPF